MYLRMLCNRMCTAFKQLRGPARVKSHDSRLPVHSKPSCVGFMRVAAFSYVSMGVSCLERMPSTTVPIEAVAALS